MEKKTLLHDHKTVDSNREFIFCNHYYVGCVCHKQTSELPWASESWFWEYNIKCIGSILNSSNSSRMDFLGNNIYFSSDLDYLWMVICLLTLLPFSYFCLYIIYSCANICNIIFIIISVGKWIPTSVCYWIFLYISIGLKAKYLFDMIPALKSASKYKVNVYIACYLPLNSIISAHW